MLLKQQLIVFLAFVVSLCVGATTSSYRNATKTLTSHTHLRGYNKSSILEFSDTNLKHHRSLVSSHNFFKPTFDVPCNVQASWSSRNYNLSQKVTIPRGHCIKMDVPGGTVLKLTKGLDIQGQLEIPSNLYKRNTMTIQTPFVIVQGLLSVHANDNTVTDVPNIKFIFVNGNSGDFRPSNTANRYACSEETSGTPELCEIGKQAFAIAGGQVDLQGMPSSCDTWVKLHDIPQSANVQIPEGFTKLPANRPNHSNPKCRRNDVLFINESFDNGDTNGWIGGDSGKVQTLADREILKVTNRLHATKDGPTLDISDFRDCLIAGQLYRFSVNVRLDKSGARGELTTCAQTNQMCIELKLFAKSTPDSKVLVTTKGREREFDRFTYGEWHSLYFDVTFTDDQLSFDDPLYYQLTLGGPEIDINIEIDDVSFGLPPPSTVPPPLDVCGGSLILNGDASASDVDPYPMRVFGSTARLEIFNGFHYTSNRASSFDSVGQYLDAQGCLIGNGVYEAYARIRVRSDTAVVATMTMTSLAKDGAYSRIDVAQCPPSANRFVECTSTITLPANFDANTLESVRMGFYTKGNSLDDFDVNDWSFELVEVGENSIVVQSAGTDCWDEGSEIIITSHTTDFESAQVRRIVTSPRYHSEGYVSIDLNETLTPSVTENHGDGFAVEVALLNRNIILESALDETDKLMGAHLIVLNTPNVAQRIDGTEFQHFGRQGELGRYPIHFHLSDTVAGSLVAKNSIRNSKQRCIVVHGTHDVRVIANVAHETTGHCFMTEDGGEVDNFFIDNIGASTRAASRIVRPFESDRSNPTTFWASNPANSWIGNVAAGSESSGFWFELQFEVREPTASMPRSSGMDPRRTMLKLFRDNVAHSNKKHGLRTYPEGYLPPSRAKFHNTKSYKNVQDGIFLHQTTNVEVNGGTLADNALQIDLDKADNISVRGTRIIGKSERYKEIIASQSGRISHDNVVGVQLHGFSNNMNNNGATISNVRFAGFSGLENTGANDVTMIDIDQKTENMHFDYWTSFEGIQFSTGSSSDLFFDFRKPAASGVTDVALIDLDSSFKPDGFVATGSSSIISSSEKMTRFISNSNARCRDFSSRGYLYCRNTCMRTITFAVDPTISKDIMLRVSMRTDQSIFYDYPGHFYTETNEGSEDTYRNTWVKKHRYFAASLPLGQYYAQFINTQTGQQTWPTFVQTTLENTECPNSIELNSIELLQPTASKSKCSQLILNGDMEDSSFSPWLHQNSGIILANGLGRSQSDAITGTEFNDATGYLAQFLDTRCLQGGSRYEIRAWVKLTETTSNNVITCEKGDTNCPHIRLQLQTSDDLEGSSFSESSIIVAQDFVRPLNNNGWNLIQTVVTFDSRIDTVTSVALSIWRGLRNAKMYVDDVSMTEITGECDNMVRNGDLSEGKTTYWYQCTANSVSSELNIVDVNDDHALILESRSSSSDAICHNIQTGCMVQNQRYAVSARVRLQNGSNGSPRLCIQGISNGINACPRLLLKSTINVGLPTEDTEFNGNYIATVDPGLTADGWYTMSGIFYATQVDGLADKSELRFGGGMNSAIDIIIDEVSISSLPNECTELFLNGNADDEETARYWRGGKANISVVRSEGDVAFKVTDRTITRDGLFQTIGTKCLSSNSIWNIRANMKILTKSGDAVTCDPLSTTVAKGCPTIRVIGFKDGSIAYDEKLYSSDSSTWNGSKTFRKFETSLTVSSTLSSCDYVQVGFMAYNIEWDSFISNISMAKQ